jgi:hypothetical protein
MLFAVLFLVGGLLALWACIEDRSADGADSRPEDSAAELPAKDRTEGPAGRGTARPDFFFQEIED